MSSTLGFLDLPAGRLTGMSYAEYGRAYSRASASPAWVRWARLAAIAATVILFAWGGNVGLVLGLATAVAAGVLAFRVDRDLRVAAALSPSDHDAGS